ncbi:tetratricopeptide (TPR) repeat protein [Saccharothrix tamanrassetensis]|uniref:Tetratricopeptide (TPR) repeat protein n=1 Tax=Saccharothrix tamanrassetensis TaxID=1051531 RepID=A0A841C882_9PSEU|nr:CHAT domain-containing protein [Saccharothrix tamanrassetensis]MBB5953609.1 tetratricopeptide (TPR) repeat protein [Saccharothrix tamanrassetensis]
MPPHSAVHEAREAVRLADTDPGRSLPAAERAARRAAREADREASALAEQAWGHALQQCGQVDEAIVHLRRSVRHGSSAGLSDLAAESRMKLAFALAQRGDTRSALREIDAALTVLTGHAGAKARAQRAVILYHVGRLDEAYADYRTAAHVLRRGDDRLALQRVMMNRGVLQAERYDFDAAERDLAEADALARALGRDLVVGIIAENLGFVAGLRGDVPTALERLERAEDIIGRHGGQTAPVLQDRAELLLSVGLVSEARHTAERAAEAFRRENRKLRVPEMLLLLAQAALVERDWATAAEHGGGALRAFTRQGRPQWAALARSAVLRAELGAGARVTVRRAETMVATLAAGRPLAAVQARLDAARLADLRGRRAVATTHLTEAARARRRGPAALRARGWYAEALLRERAGNPRGASHAARTGLRVLDEHHAALGASDLRAHSATHRADLADLGLRVALAGGRPAAVFEWAERGRASRFLHRPVRPPDDPELAELLPRLRAVTAELERTPGGTRLASRQVDLERRIRDRSRLLRADPTSPTRQASPRDLAEVLGDRALVEYLQVGDSLLALSLVDGRLRLHTLGPASEVADLLDRVPFALRRLTRPGNAKPAETLLRGTASRLDRLLLAPTDVGDRPLVVVPTGVLHSLPWSILPSCAGRPVAVSPSAALWHEAATRPPLGGDVLVAGGPGLPGAREEATAVASIHGTTALLDEAATVDAVLTALATAGTAHLAAHGVLAADNPLFSALRLHDGRLIVHDVQRLKRVPDTVLLAACDVGRSVVCSGDELLGLSATFIERGAARVIASVVPIPDTETRPLMTAVHRRLASGEPPAEALAAAQREVSTTDPAAFAAAAGFVCIGAG